MSSGNWINISIKKNNLQFKSQLGTPSQAESQKIIYLLPIIDHFLENELVNATELEQDLPISRDSIDRTIQLLLNYNLIKLHKVSLKNKKFYTLKNKRIVEVYRKKLLQWLWIKETKQDRKTVIKLERILRSRILGKQGPRTIKKIMHGNRRATDILDKPMEIEKLKHSKNRKLEPVLIDSLPYSKAWKIIRDYLNGKFCEVCLKKKRLTLLQTDSEGFEEGCSHGHVFPNTLV